MGIAGQAEGGTQMKRFCRILCAAATGLCMTAFAGAAEGAGALSPQGARAYLELLEITRNLYGTAQVTQEGPYTRMWEGLCLAKLIDFDGDGIPELYCAGRPAGGRFTQSLYTYQNGKTIPLSIPRTVSNFGTDVSPSTLFYIGAGKAYLVDGQEVMNGNDVNYFTKQGNQIVSAFVCTGISWDGVCTVNGKAVSAEELEAQKKAVTQGMAEVSFSFWSGESQDLDQTVTQTIDELNKLATPTAAASSDQLLVDGKSVQLPVYKIAGNNYYMLRGIAQALAGTEAQFAVGWDSSQGGRIFLTKGQAYTPVGGETGSSQPGAVSAMPTSSAVYLDGVPLALTAYHIHGNNYFKLRDLGKALGFSVAWEQDGHRVLIHTGS